MNSLRVAFGTKKPQRLNGSRVLSEPQPRSKGAVVSEAQTPEEETIETDLAQIPDDDVPVADEYDGPDPEADPKGDGSDEDQGI